MFYSGLRCHTNRRYGERQDIYRINREAERRTARPVSLTERELDVEHDPVKRGRHRFDVRAWVTFDDGRTARIIGAAEEWTSRAVRVRWSVGDGQAREAWVWASAVEKL